MLRIENTEIWKRQRNEKIVYRVSESLNRHRCGNCKSTLPEEKKRLITAGDVKDILETYTTFLKSSNDKYTPSLFRTCCMPD